MRGHTHSLSAETQNQGNVLGDRSSVRQSKFFRQYESGNTMKGLLGSSNLAWNVNEKEGAYKGQAVYDFNGQAPTLNRKPYLEPLSHDSSGPSEKLNSKFSSSHPLDVWGKGQTPANSIPYFSSDFKDDERNISRTQYLEPLVGRGKDLGAAVQNHNSSTKPPPYLQPIASMTERSTTGRLNPWNRGKSVTTTTLPNVNALSTVASGSVGRIGSVPSSKYEPYTTFQSNDDRSRAKAADGIGFTKGQASSTSSSQTQYNSLPRSRLRWDDPDSYGEVRGDMNAEEDNAMSAKREYHRDYLKELGPHGAAAAEEFRMQFNKLSQYETKTREFPHNMAHTGHVNKSNQGPSQHAQGKASPNLGEVDVITSFSLGSGSNSGNSKFIDDYVRQQYAIANDKTNTRLLSVWNKK